MDDADSLRTGHVARVGARHALGNIAFVALEMFDPQGARLACRLVAEGHGLHPKDRLSVGTEVGDILLYFL